MIEITTEQFVHERWDLKLASGSIEVLVEGRPITHVFVRRTALGGSLSEWYDAYDCSDGGMRAVAKKLTAYSLLEIRPLAASTIRLECECLLAKLPDIGLMEMRNVLRNAVQFYSQDSFNSRQCEAAQDHAEVGSSAGG